MTDYKKQKMTEERMNRILLATEFGFTRAEVMKRFEVSGSTLSRIIEGKTWTGYKEIMATNNKYKATKNVDKLQTVDDISMQFGNVKMLIIDGNKQILNRLTQIEQDIQVIKDKELFPDTKLPAPRKTKPIWFSK